jgi:predicted dienelactone hydrolase
MSWTWIALWTACAPREVDEVEVVDPTVQGTFTVERIDGITLDLGDRGGGFVSTVPALVYVPADADGPVPVVVWSHGFVIDPREYYTTLVHLASWGIAVVAPTWDSGFAASRTHAGLATDLRAALDALQQTPVEAGVTFALDRFGAGGHSRGGKQSLLAAVSEPRIVASFNLDPVDALPPFTEVDPAEYPSVAPELAGGITIPVGMIGAGRAAEGEFPCAPPEDGFQAYFDAIGSDVWLGVLPTGGHNDFVDACADGEGGFACATCAPGEDPVAARALAAGMMTAFYLKHLSDDARFDGWLDGELARERGLDVRLK